MMKHGFADGFRGLILGVLLLASALSVFAAAPMERTPRADAIVYRGWQSDPDGTLSPQDVSGRAWTPFTGLLSRGFTSSTTWVRLVIDPAATGPGSLADDHRLVLQIVPGHLDEVAVFRTDRLAEPPVLVGDHHLRAQPSRSIVDEVVFPDATAPFEVLLRVRSASNHSLQAQVLRWDAARDFVAFRINLALAYLIFILMILAWALTTWSSDRDPAIRLFIVQQVLALFVGSSLLGALRLIDSPMLPDRLLDTFGSVVIPALVAVMARFHARILAQLGGRAADVKCVAFLAWPAMAALALILSGWVRSGLQFTQYLILLTNVLALCTALRVRRPDGASGDAVAIPGKTYLVTMYAMMIIVMLPQWLRVEGLLPAGPWSFGGYFVYTVASSLLLANLLTARMSAIRERSRRAELAYQQSRHDAAAQRTRAAEQSELVAMLAHELKTPLSTISLALGTGELPGRHRSRAMRAIDSMRSVIDRCDQAARLDDAMARPDVALDLQPVALDDVLLDAIGAQNDDQRLDLSLPADLPPCFGERPSLRVICTNLIENALKYSPDDSKVRVSLAPLAANGRAGLSLRVSNAVGPAGKPDTAQLFEKFYRAPNARSRSGSGLGLYLSRRVAARLGAELDCDLSDPDAVSFRLWVPCAPIRNA